MERLGVVGGDRVGAGSRLRWRLDVRSCALAALVCAYARLHCSRDSPLSFADCAPRGNPPPEELAALLTSDELFDYVRLMLEAVIRDIIELEAGGVIGAGSEGDRVARWNGGVRLLEIGADCRVIWRG